MLQMTKKVEKTTLYRLFFEICSVTTFLKNLVYSVTKPLVTPPPSIRPLVQLKGYNRGVHLRGVTRLLPLIGLQKLHVGHLSKTPHTYFFAFCYQKFHNFLKILSTPLVSNGVERS